MGGLTDDPRLYETDPADDNGDPRLRTAAKIEGAVTGSFSPSGLTVKGITTKVLVPSASWVKLERSGTSTPTGTGPLADRNSITVQNQSGVDMKIRLELEDTTYTGVLMKDGGSRYYDVTDDIDVFIRAASGTDNVAILEEIA